MIRFYLLESVFLSREEKQVGDGEGKMKNRKYEYSTWRRQKTRYRMIYLTLESNELGHVHLNIHFEGLDSEGLRLFKRFPNTFICECFVGTAVGEGCEGPSQRRVSHRYKSGFELSFFNC